MHSAAIIASFLASLALSNAISVESPTKDTVWESSGSQTVEWKAVDTDPTSFEIQLVNQVSNFCGRVEAGVAQRSHWDKAWLVDITLSPSASFVLVPPSPPFRFRVQSANVH